MSRPGTEPTLTVTPSEALLDEELAVVAEGLPAGQEVTLVAAWADDGRFRGEATFVADDDGVVDPTEQAPIAGDYEGVRPMGLVQFAHEVDDADATDDGRDADDDVADGHRLELSLRVEGEVRDRATVVRRELATEATKVPVEDDDLVGDLFLPPGDGPHPGVVLLGGSGGGIPSGVRAKLLASRGYAVLALAYFQPSELGADAGDGRQSLDRLPESLIEVPLSYFDGAVSWLEDHDQVDGIGVVGGSRGSEPAVLTTARNDAVSSVVVFAPLAYAFCTFDFEEFGAPAWVEDGDPYPYLTNSFGFGRAGFFLRSFWYALTGGQFSFAPSFRRAVEDADPEERQAATLPVEAADAPVMIVSGGDDELAPSEYMGKRLVERLDEREYGYVYEHHNYPDAGHLIAPPYTPVRGRDVTDPVFRNMRIALGGTPEGYAAADVDYWERLLAFLDGTLAVDGD